MILVGNQRGGAKDLALHLLKDENDHVELHELRGFASDTLMGALMETYAISRGTKAKQFMFSLSLNPPPEADVPTTDFKNAIERIEKKLGLNGQPRAIVFHEKEGRRHAHAVWSRIDGERMKAIPMSHSGLKLMDVSRELYREHGWAMPRGLADRSQCDPRNFTLAEWQQAKRVDRDPRDIKTALRDAWSISDSKAAFTHALAERGFQLAKGDRRGFVAIDYRGETFALRQWADVKLKEQRHRLGPEDKCQSVADAKEHIATGMLAKMQDFQRELDEKAERERKEFEQKRQALVNTQRAERAALSVQHLKRQAAENQERQARFRRGFKGLWDRVRGEHRRIMEQNLREAQQASARDQSEKDRLVQDQLTKRRELVKGRAQERAATRDEKRGIQKDTQTYHDMQMEWRTKAIPPTAPTKVRKPRSSERPKRQSRNVKSAQKIEKPVPKQPPILKREFESTAKDTGRRATFKKKRADQVSTPAPKKTQDAKPVHSPERATTSEMAPPDSGVESRRDEFRRKRVQPQNRIRPPARER